MAIRIERTDGLVLMSPEEIHAEALKKPGAFFHICYQSDAPADVGDNLQGLQ